LFVELVKELREGDFILQFVIGKEALMAQLKESLPLFRGEWVCIERTAWFGIDYSAEEFVVDTVVLRADMACHRIQDAIGGMGVSRRGP
jgi:hypothetical protein